MECIADFACYTGECPLWRQEEQKLYWCDIPSGKIYCWSARTAEACEVADAGESLGGMTLEADGGLLCFLHRGRVARWQQGRWTTLLQAQPELVADRFNDVIAQPDGTVLCGTMPDEAGNARLYRLDRQLKLTLVMEGLKLSNGMGYSPDLGFLYLADTRGYLIYRFDYQLTTGMPVNPQPFIDFRNRPGRPDGLTVDREGNLWVAEIGASQVVKFSPEGRELETVPLPVPRVTSLLFGGVNWRQLFITSSSNGQRPEQSCWGATFRCRPKAVGLPEFSSTIGC